MRVACGGLDSLIIGEPQILGMKAYTGLKNAGKEVEFWKSYQS
jgi:glutamyl-tRNA reductase